MLTGLNKIHLLKVGHCKHPEIVTIKGGKWHCRDFPALVGVLHHPQKGWILFDTGYSEFFFQATNHIPEKFYRWLTPVVYEQQHSLLNQLKLLNISTNDINYIFISHFHGDHIGSLKDFPKATFICAKQGFEDFHAKNRFNGLLKGYLPSLLPRDFAKRMMFVEDCKIVNLSEKYAPFSQGIDLFSDLSMIAIELPGHAKGHWGLLCQHNEKTYFFIGDACWSQKAFQEYRLPNSLAYVIMDNSKFYNETIAKLHQLYKHSDIEIMPSHCELTFQRWNDA